MRHIFHVARCRCDFLIPPCKGIGIIFVRRFRRRFACIYGEGVFFYFARLQYRAVVIFKGYRVERRQIFFYHNFKIIEKIFRARRLHQHICGIRRNIRRERTIRNAVYRNRKLFICNRNRNAVPSIVIKGCRNVRDPTCSTQVRTQPKGRTKREAYTCASRSCRSYLFFREEAYVELLICIGRRKIYVKGNFLILRQIQRRF